MSVAGYFCLCVSNHLFIHPPIPPSIAKSQATPTHFPYEGYQPPGCSEGTEARFWGQPLLSRRVISPAANAPSGLLFVLSSSDRS